MLFNKSNGTFLTTIWAEPSVLMYLETNFNIPKIYLSAWDSHYISIEFFSPVNNTDTVIARIYTSQSTDFRLPLARDAGDIIVPPKLQAMSPGYVIEARGTTINSFRQFLEQQIQNPARQMNSTILNNINNLQKKPGLQDPNFHINLIKLVTHEKKVDNQVFPGKSTTMDNTATIINTKYNVSGRKTIENNIISYNKSEYISPKTTVDFYKGARIGLQQVINDSQIPGVIKSKYVKLDFETEQILIKLQKRFGY